MKKLLVICGPTATGKTKLAGLLAKKFDGEIVSADSKQVFKGLDIGTGKEYVEDVKIWGYDLVSAKSEFSIAQYLKFARHAISDIQKRGKLPIVTGGTGFYIKGIVSGIPTSVVPRNKFLRKLLETKSTDDLLESLSQLDAVKVASLNFSDRKNPRRLIRAIEIAQWKLEHGQIKSLAISHQSSVLKIGLKSDPDVLNSRIEKRVDERVFMGAEGEVRRLLKNGVNWDNQSMHSLGYRQWRDFLEGDTPKEIVIDEWKREERKYAKRQMTWFKKDKSVKWFDISDSEYPNNVEKLVAMWHKDILF